MGHPPSERPPADPATLSGEPSPVVSLLVRSRLLSALFVIAVALGLTVPGIGAVPPIDRDESRFVQATRQMHERADYIDIRLGDEARYRKPVGAYWAQALATAPLGGAAAPVWAFRLPSILGAVLAGLATLGLGTLLFGRRAGLVAAVLAVATIGIAVEARLAKADALLIGLTALAQALLAHALFAPDRGGAGGKRTPLASAAFGLVLGLGALVKGPILLGIVAATSLAMLWRDRSIARLARVWSWPALLVFLLVVLPWFLAIQNTSAGRFLADSLGRDLFGKLQGGQEGHGAPPGLHLVLLPFVAWPATAFVAAALPLLRDWRERSVFFLLAWIVPAWLAFELTPSKLPHYPLPLYPALALIAAGGIARARLLGPRWRGGLATLAVLLPVAVAIGVLGWFLYAERRIPAGLETGFALSIGLAGLSAFAVFRDRLERASLLAVAGAAALYITLFQLVPPRVPLLFPSVAVVEAANAALRCRPIAFASTRYREPSLFVAAGTRTRFLDAAEGAAFLAGGPCRLLVVTEEEEATILLAGTSAGSPVARIAAIDAFNYSRGRRMTLVLLARSPVP